ncbi:MAG: hypothetical protein JXB39_15280 [Deltaproteobacteria bacterium]|nr:hypothetical protein [Deltaproteobacteria bacterium]
MNGLQFAYQYLVGGAFFLATLRLCMRPTDGAPLPPSDRRAVRVLVGGLGIVLLGHAAWILAVAT